MDWEKHSRILGPVDTAFFYVDTPETPMNIGAVNIFEGQLEFDKLLKLIDARIHQAPIYQQRIIQAPFNLGQPTWVFDPDFSIENHVFQISLPEPGTEEQLRQVSGKLMSSMLDRSKPLWEVYLIKGLEGDRSGLFFKVHHCMVDGLAAIEIFTLLMDLSPETPPLPQKPRYDPPPLPTNSEMIWDAIRADLPFKWDILNKIGDDFATIASVISDKEERRKALTGVANVINDNLRPIRKMAVNGKNTGQIAMAWTDFSLQEIRAIKSNRGASVNDVMLTILSMAYDKYLDTVDGKNMQEFMRVLVPVSMRTQDEKNSFGNRVSVLPVDLPFGIKSPLERLDRISTYSRIMKDSSLSVTLDLTLSLPSLAMAPIQPMVWNIAPVAFAFLAHMWCTNVAGPQIPVYMLGHKLMQTYGYFPLNASLGTACVIASYNQRIGMNIMADEAIVPDVTKIRDFLNESFLELRSAAKVEPMETINLQPAKVPKATPGSPPPVRRAPPPPKVRNRSADKAASSNIATISQPGPYSNSPRIADPPAEEASSTVADAGSKTEDTETVETSLDNAPPTKDEPTDQVQLNGKETHTNGVEANGSQPVSKADDTTPSEATQPVTPVTDNPPETRESTAEVPETPTDTGPKKIFTEPWAKAYQEAINNNDAYYKASTRWTAGPLAFVMKVSLKNGFSEPVAVLLDLHKGKCRNARKLSPAEAERAASFVIEGEYDSWIKVLNGEAQPLPMIMRGKLQLKKGAMTRLLPFTTSAQELIRSAQMID